MTTVLYTLHIVPERSGQLPVATSQKHPQFQDLKVKVKGVQVHFFLNPFSHVQYPPWKPRGDYISQGLRCTWQLQVLPKLLLESFPGWFKGTKILRYLWRVPGYLCQSEILMWNSSSCTQSLPHGGFCFSTYEFVSSWPCSAIISR